MTDAELEDRIARIDAFEHRMQGAAEALTAVLEDPEFGGYGPQRDDLLDALRWLEIESTCGSCVDGSCHTGSESTARAAGTCGCPRHEASMQARLRRDRLVTAGILAVTDPYRRPPERSA